MLISLDPVSTSLDLTKRYLSYIKTTFFIRDDEIRKKFEEALSEEKISKGPILEVTPPFVSGQSISSLVDEGILSSEFLHIKSDAIPKSFYLHQEKAIRALTSNKKNIIAATGTGSGKTEIYLIPILNALMREKEKGTLGPGVRALLLYPMNALVNDQLKRMRTLLEGYPDITFGRYTGETEENQNKAEEIYIQENNSKPLFNELISRERMRANPPHILLTNYAMLEYLLLRPRDMDLFEGNYSGKWSFIVLDEIHTYTGAKGIEIALLIRRLKNRVIPDNSKRLQCIGTSATLAGGAEDIPNIVRFAQDIFGEPFDQEDIITASRLPFVKPDKSISIRPELFIEWAAYLEKETDPDILYFKNSLLKEGIESDLIDEWEKNSKGSYTVFLYLVLSRESSILALQKYLDEHETPYFLKLAQDLFPGFENGKEIAESLISIAVQAKSEGSDYPLIPARYHFFIRALEGAYIAFTPSPTIFTEPIKEFETDNGSYRAFEIGICRHCGEVYLVGYEKGNYLEHPLPVSEEYHPTHYFLLKSDPIEIDADEESTISTQDHPGELFKLCVKCGRIQKSSLFKDFCKCGPKYTIEVYHALTNGSDLHTCLSCSQTTTRGSIVHRVIAGKDAISSVLVTELYHHIPPKEIKIETQIPDNDSGWIVTPTMGQIEKTERREARKLLVFSDSRQDAAFFAPYLNRTYHQVQRKALLLSILHKYHDNIVANQWTLNDFVQPIVREIKQLHICNQSYSDQDIENIVWKWLISEFYTFEQRLNLEQLGLLCFTLKKPDSFPGIKALQSDPWNLTAEEIWTLLTILLNTLRKKMVFQFPDTVSPDDEFFAPQNRASYIRLNESSKYPQILTWSPLSSIPNSRLDYLLRLTDRLNTPPNVVGKTEALDVLNKIWTHVFAPHNQGSYFKDYFVKSNLLKKGIVYQLDTRKWTVDSPYLNKGLQWYECDTCHKVTPHNIRGVCPTFRCKGQLHPISPEETFKDNHYYQLYTTLTPKRFHAEEHTAQLKKSYARTLQSDFIQGNIDILCCSTTFELGVDVGELETVFLKNVPPSPANYIQRAGRAGRRTNSTAFCVTLCQVRSHDFHHFLEPERMVRGKIIPPYFSIENEKIVRRHLMAMALSVFWREPEYTTTFGTVNDFFFLEDFCGADLLREFLRRKPKMLQESFEKVIPDGLQYLINDASGEWKFVSDMYDPTNGPLARTHQEIVSDIVDLNALYQKRVGQTKKADYLLNIKSTLLGRTIINFLATHNVLPKYGFPVDVVELAIYSPAGKNLDLSRDLKIALSEYAPGSDIVAAGKIWTSRYVKKLLHSDKGLEQRYYVICPRCKRYYTSLDETLPNVCEACEYPLLSDKKLIKPEFGFIADGKGPKKPQEKRPEKTYSTRVFYTGVSNDKKTIPLPLPNGNTLLRATNGSNAKFGVINSGKYGHGFKICSQCGYTLLGQEPTPNKHNNPFNQKCSGGYFEKFDLGHEFMTDMVKLTFEHYNAEIPDKEGPGFWQSLLYGLLDGTSDRLDIERDDIDGCIYFEKGKKASLVLFDSVPGGAGHVKRLVQEENMLIEILWKTLENLSKCQCGGEEGESSCYGCLRNYYNQYCHPDLKRGPVIRFLRSCLAV